MKKKPAKGKRQKRAPVRKTKKTGKVRMAVKRATKKVLPKKNKAKKPLVKKVKKTQSHPRSEVIPPVNGVLLGYVEDYFAKVGVIGVTLLEKLAVGSHLHVLGYTTNFEQTVDSMQIDHQSVALAGPKSDVGIKVTARARRGDHVYIIP